MIKYILILFFLKTFLLAHEKNYICYDKWPNASPPYHFTPNKCGPDSPLAKLIPNKFGSVDLSDACNQHDRCWMELKNLNQYGRCEVLFTKDLIKACNKAERCFATKCIANPIEIAACQSIIVPSYAGAATTSLFLQRIQKARDDQKDFEKCISEHGYFKRDKKTK